MTTSKPIEQLLTEITCIHGSIHPDIAATVATIGDRIDLLEKTALVLLAAYKVKDMEGFQTAMRLIEVMMLPPPEIPPSPAAEEVKP